MLRTHACGFYTQVCCIPSGSQELGSAERKVSVNATNVKLFLQILGGALCTHITVGWAASPSCLVT